MSLTIIIIPSFGHMSITFSKFPGFFAKKIAGKSRLQHFKHSMPPAQPWRLWGGERQHYFIYEGYSHLSGRSQMLIFNLVNHSTRIMYKMVGVLDIIIYTKNLSDRIIEIGLNSIKPSSLILASSLDKDVLWTPILSANAFFVMLSLIVVEFCFLHS